MEKQITKVATKKTRSTAYKMVLLVLSALIITGIGSILHLLGERLQLRPNFMKYAFLLPINESVWEHYKLFFYPYIAFAIISLLFPSMRLGGFSGWLNKLAYSLVLSLVFMIGIYGGLYLIFGENMSIGIISTILTNIIGLSIYFCDSPSPKMSSKLMAVVSLVIIALMVFSVFVYTYRPLDLPLFIPMG